MFKHNKKREIRLLFILAAEFGELLYAHYFTRGYDFDSAYVLPPSLYKLNKTSLPTKSYVYKNLNDLKKIITLEQPKIVFLFSGYLLTLNKLLNHNSLKELIDFCQDLNITVATDDFSLNIWPNLNNFNCQNFNLNNPLHNFFIENLKLSRNILKNAYHLYGVAVKNLSDSNHLTFFNPYLLKPAVFQLPVKKSKNNFNPRSKTKAWLFILADEEFIVQSEKLGEQRFIEQILAQLKNSSNLGKQPILLAPRRCLELIKQHKEKINNLILLSACPFNQYLQLLFSVEYVFYWNVFSFSIIVREFNLLPVFYFTFGHMIEKFPPLREYTWECYQTNREPLGLLDPNKPLDLVELKNKAKLQLKSTKKALVRHKRIIPNTPPVIIAKILRKGNSE